MIRAALAVALIVAADAASAAAAPACWDRAAERYAPHSAALLRAIAAVESGRDNSALNVNANGSKDVCMMQINSSHFPRLARYGITERILRADECVCVMAGAFILAEFVSRYGLTWRAVGHYNSPTPERAAAYAGKVYRAFRSENPVPEAADPKTPQTVTDHGPLFAVAELAPSRKQDR